MALSNQAKRANRPQDDTTSEAPLLSDDGRNFLAGKIGADEYVGMARDVAAAQARKDFNYRLRERRIHMRKTGLVGLLAVTIAYVILGLVTLLSAGKGIALPIAAFITGGFTGLVALSYGRHRQHGLIIGLLNHLLERSDWATDHNPRNGS
jgi:hypothetical protein